MTKIFKNVMGRFKGLYSFLSAGNMVSDILVFIIVMMLGLGIYMKGYSDSSISCAKKETAGIEQNVKQYGQTKREVLRMDESDLDHELSKWMRD